MNYGIVIQARTSSSRLPGKVLLDIEGLPMLFRQVDRLRQEIIDIPIIVATSNETSDDPVESMCDNYDINCYRGPLDDVMLRFIECADRYNLDFFVRVGGDDPLIDPKCCKELISTHKANNYDFIYASNREGWPYGAAAELISVNKLKEIHKNTNDAFYREHTIPYFFDNFQDFNIKKVRAPEDVCRPDYYFTVDFPEDLELVRQIFKSLVNQGSYFSFKEVINLIDQNPSFLEINKHLHEGFDR